LCCADLASALQIDLEEYRSAFVERGADRAARRAVAMLVVHRGPLEQLAVSDEAVELGVVDEIVVDAVDLAGTRGSRRRGHGEQDVGVVVADVCRDGPLADRGRSGENEEAAAPGARAGLREPRRHPSRQLGTL